MFIEFVPQCCDAFWYLTSGADCASKGICYNDLRPLGSTLWFALPLWLGLPQQSMIFANLLLILVSVLMGSRALSRWFITYHGTDPLHVSTGLKVLLAVVATASHGIFFLPVWQTSLVDPPAALFALIALWCLILSGLRAEGSLWLNSIAGLLLGLAAWVRVYYLYPYILVLCMAGAAWIFRRSRRVALLGLFLGLLPVATQLYHTYQHHGYVSFLAHTQTERWTNIHLNDSSKGYDTVLPPAAHKWPSNCQSVLGPWESLTTGHWKDSMCFYGGKFSFYFGSYAPETYISPKPAGTAIRHWSVYILVLNLCILAVAAFYTVTGWRVLRLEGTLAASFIALCQGLALMIVPEQRFILVVHVAAWMIGLYGLIFWVRQNRHAHTAAAEPS